MVRFSTEIPPPCLLRFAAPVGRTEAASARTLARQLPIVRGLDRPHPRKRCDESTNRTAKRLSRIWTQPRAKGVCRVEGEAGCSRIFGLFGSFILGSGP